METVINLNEVVRASQKDNRGFLNAIGLYPDYSIKIEMTDGRNVILYYELDDYDLFCKTWKEITQSINSNLTINT